MSRQKMALERIPDDVARCAAFRNLLNVLTEKAGELATLCNAKVCVLVYAEGEAQPVVWPSVAEAVPILQRFKATPEIKQYKKSVTQEDFLRQRMDKLKLQIQKSAPENIRRDTALLLHKAMRGQLQGGLEGLGIEKLTSVGWMVHMRLKGLRELIVKRQEQAALQFQPLPAPAPAYQQEASQHDEGDLGALVFSDTANDDGVGTNGGFSWQWFADLGTSSSSYPPM